MATKRIVKSFKTPEYQAMLEVIRDARTRSGISQRQLSESLDQVHNYINHVENGRRRIDVIEFFNIAESLGVDPEEMFSATVRELRKLQKS